MLTPKRGGSEIGLKTFNDENGISYLVFRSLEGSYHVFAEVEAKEAARSCGATVEGNTRKKWDSLWYNASAED